ncbi:MAG: ABC transporter substrate-binding protein, partial [Alphaproteobacteria bacterium]|nr:ABC transporter substrate-binding protein [Alphaproteobacteria bacterium]
VKTVSFVSWNGVGGTANLEAGLDAAKKVGLEVISSDAVYELGTTDFFPVMGSVVQGKPDLIVLSGVSPAEAPLLIRAARELGYQGIMSTETAQDAKVLEEVAGTAADGFISIGGASAPELASEYMGKFRDRYIQVAGEWNDEAGTKVYALYMLLKTIQAAGPAVIDDVEAF